jgi:hypothetical protein
MKKHKSEPNLTLIDSVGKRLSELQDKYDYPEIARQLANGGSSQVLGDFFEFSDYLIPSGRGVQVNGSNSKSIPDDIYSALPGL